MTRAIAENTNRLSVFFLKKHGYLPQEESRRYGRIVWTRGLEEDAMSFWVKTEESGGYVELIYTNTNCHSGDKTGMKYKVPLTTTPCFFGGRRYWFLCPLTNNGTHCGRRAGVLYAAGKWFGCRHCSNVAYQAQFYGGSIRTGVSEQDIEKACGEVKREYYNGRPTKKYKRYLRLSNKMDNFKAKVFMKYGVKF